MSDPYLDLYESFALAVVGGLFGLLVMAVWLPL